MRITLAAFALVSGAAIVGACGGRAASPDEQVDNRDAALASLATDASDVTDSGWTPPKSDASPGKCGRAISPASETAIMDTTREVARKCYSALLKRKADAAGQLLIKLDVFDDGTVRNVSLDKDTIGDQTMKDCVLDKIRPTRFPALDTGCGGSLLIPVKFVLADSGT